MGTIQAGTNQVGTIINELWQLSDSKTHMSGWYTSRIERRHANAVDYPPWRTTLQSFLSSTMDEVRLHRASQFAKETLKLPAFEEVIPFRVAVLQREAGADTSYDKQRDHTAHTVNNWLLGWLFYQHSQKLREAFAKAIDDRKLLSPTRPSCAEAFGDVWTYASILHDIGYLFEGGIEKMSWHMHHEMARRGALLVNDFFGNRIWHEWEVHNAADRRAILDCGYKHLRLPVDGSVGGIVEGLQDMGGLGPLLADVKTSVAGQALHGLNGDRVGAFELWRAHYQNLGNQSMATRVDHARDDFGKLAYEGLPKVGLRVIDHGVASGLLLLQLITMYYAIRSTVRTKTDWCDPQSQRNFMGDAGKVDYQPLFWWNGILWGTFATAFHNIQQTDPSKRKAPLKIEEDPLAYLGILVDTLQEWDRYMVRREAVLADEPALQGVDVRAQVKNQILEVNLLTTKRCEKTIEDLDRALHDWQSFVDVQPK